MAIVNFYRYSNKSYIIGQSATKPLSPLRKDMRKAQRLNGGGVEKSSKLL
jgi:hypothetical protein